MDLLAQLHDTSRLLAEMVADALIDSPEEIENALRMVETAERPFPMRLSRVIWLVSVKNNGILGSYIQKIYSITFSTKNESVRRNFLNILLNNTDKLTESNWGELVDKCFTWLEIAKTAPAIKAISIKLLVKAMKIYPELAPELLSSLNNLDETFTPAVKAVIKNIHKELKYLSTKKKE